MNLTFDQASHTYRLDDRRVPSVTQAIKAVCGIGWEAAEFYLDRGTQLHAAAPLIAAGKLDWKTWEAQLRDAFSAGEVESILGRAKAIEKFLRESDLKPVFFEFRMASPTLQVAGTADLIAEDLNGKPVLVDYKGSHDPRVEIQLGFYSLLWSGQNKQPFVRAMAVKLNDDGTYKLHIGTRTPKRDHAHFDLSTAENIARHVRSVLAWMQTNKLYKEE